MKRYLETFFRYWLIALVPIIALPAVEGMSVRHLPHLFTAGLNVYAEASLINSDPSSGYLTPAQIEAASINQWLQSPSFCLSVAKGSPLYARSLQLASDPLTQASNDICTHAQAVAKGDNLVNIAYTGADPQVAMQVVKSLLDVATTRTQTLQAQQASAAKNYYQFQLYTAQAQERSSAQRLTDYMQQHGITANNLTQQLASDPTLAGLYQQNRTDFDNVTSLRAKVQSYLDQSSLPSSVVNQSGYVLADPPHYYTASNRKTAIMDLGIALVLGLLLGIGFIVLMTALDRSLRQPEEVPDMLDLPVLAIVPYSQAFARRRIDAAGTANQAGQMDRAKGANAS